MTAPFQAVLITREDGVQKAALTTLEREQLPPGAVTVAVEASSLNYKDGLLLTGAIPLIQSYPMVPGIDLAGIVEQSEDPRWKPGDRVIANGWGLGERHWGGYAGYARVHGDWLVKCPSAFTIAQAMAIGTAGYTAMLCVQAIERHGVRPGDGEVLVTGSSGGVGSVAIALLAGRGYRVAAATGREEETPYLKALGASEVIARSAFAAPGAPLQVERWAAAVDTAGSVTLANICASLRYGGVVAATGIAQGTDFPATMFPLALRGVTICGIDSVMVPQQVRKAAWSSLARKLDPALLDGMTSHVPLDQIIERAPDILAGRIRGRIVVDITKRDLQG